MKHADALEDHVQLVVFPHDFLQLDYVGVAQFFQRLHKENLVIAKIITNMDAIV